MSQGAGTLVANNVVGLMKLIDLPSKGNVRFSPDFFRAGSKIYVSFNVTLICPSFLLPVYILPFSAGWTSVNSSV